MKEYIFQYLDQGFYIFPCNLDKTPATEHGFYDASNEKDKVSRQFYKDELLIGLPTGTRNGIIVIDFDINKKNPITGEIDNRTVDELGKEVVENFGPLPDTFQVQTKSGGRHLYYKIPEGVEIKSGARFLDKSLPVDIRGEGGYVVAAGSTGYIVYDDADGTEIQDIVSKIANIPEWLLRHERRTAPSNDLIIPETVLPEAEIKEIRSALAYLSSDDRDSWIQVGLALKSTGSPSGYGLWNEWSKTSPKYDPNDMEKRWAGLKPNSITIASLFHEAKKYGWITTYQKNTPINVPAIQNTNLEEFQGQHIKKEFKKEPFPQELLSPPGLVGEIMEYIIDKSIMPQPVFALSASLCAIGALAGRKVQTETGIRTNIYCLNVGGSGSGKEAPRKAIKSLFHMAGCGEMASVENLASDSAIETAVNSVNSQIFLLDEIGRFLETTKKGATHLYNVISVLLKLYSSSDQVYYGKNYADATRKIKIEHPNLCLLGTTVPDTLYKGLTYESATDGFLSRMLIFETDTNRPRKDRGKNLLKEPPESLINKIIKLKEKPINMVPEGNLDPTLHPRPQIVKQNENARDIFEGFDDYIYDLRDELESKDQIDAVYNRSAQMAEQIALIVATGNNIDSPVITEKEAMYGVQLSKYLADHMHYIVENYMAKNDFEHEVKRVLNVIRNVGCITLSDLSRKTQNLQGHVRTDILTTLINSSQVNESLVGEGVHMTRVYTAI